MLEEIISAVEYARVCHVLKNLVQLESGWEQRTETIMQEPEEKQSLSDILGILPAETVILPSRITEDPIIVTEGVHPLAEQFLIHYTTGKPDESVSYLIRSNKYKKVAQYDVPRTNIFYVHIPPWASIKDADQLELGEHVLGTAQPGTGQIRLLHSLDPVQRAEVLLHETLHLLYPLHEEKAIRDMVRGIIGKQYCCFH